MPKVKSIVDASVEYSENGGVLSTEEYKFLAKEYAKFIVNKIFAANCVSVGELGSFEVEGRKDYPRVDVDGNIKGLIPDHRATQDLWKKCPECKEKKEIIFQENLHTDGFRYKIVWHKRKCEIPNNQFYSLAWAKYTVKRKLASVIKSGEVEFAKRNQRVKR